jgi:hypothetical protein
MTREQWRTLSEIWLDSTPKSLGSQTISVASGPNRKREVYNAFRFCYRADRFDVHLGRWPFPQRDFYASLRAVAQHGQRYPLPH